MEFLELKHMYVTVRLLHCELGIENTKTKFKFNMIHMNITDIRLISEFWTAISANIS